MNDWTRTVEEAIDEIIAQEQLLLNETFSWIASAADLGSWCRRFGFNRTFEGLPGRRFNPAGWVRLEIFLFQDDSTQVAVSR